MTSSCISVDGCPKAVIVGLSEYAHELMERTIVFMDKHGLEQWERPTYQQMSDLVYALIDDDLNQIMIWTRARKDRAEDLFDKYLPWFNAYKTNEIFQDIHDLYIHEILDHVELKIHNLIWSIISNKTWDMWSITPLGKDLILSKGPDYRIVDWERRMAMGVWSMDDDLGNYGLEDQLFETFAKKSKKK